MKIDQQNFNPSCARIFYFSILQITQMNITQEANEMTIKDSFVVKGFKGFEPVKMVGGYKLTKDPMNKTFAKKPSKFHRICTRFFLGWVWEDSDINFYSI